MSNQSLDGELFNTRPVPIVRWPNLVFLLVATALLAVVFTLGTREVQNIFYPPSAREKAEQPRKLVSIRAETSFDGLHMVARFDIEPLADSSGVSKPVQVSKASKTSAEDDKSSYDDIKLVRWKLGNGESTLGRQGNAVYPLPGKHVVEVEALNESGRLIGWDILDIDAQTAKNDTTAKVASFAVSTENDTEPHDVDGAGNHYLTVPAVGSLFAIEGSTHNYSGFTAIDQSFAMAGNAGQYTLLRALKAGFFEFSTVESKYDTKFGHSQIIKRNYFVFVSPIPSKHVDRSDMDWYMTQFNTETTSNCGPTVTAMSIKWAKGVDIAVTDVRDMVGWDGDGAVSMNQLQTVMDHYNVRSRLIDTESPDEIFKILDKGHLVAVSYNMAGVAQVDDPKDNLLGQYYTDDGGHYLALKGYSLDRKYVIVYDPIPSDWATNTGRYGDGVSMYGRNRYYPIDQLWNALRTHQILEISR